MLLQGCKINFLGDSITFGCGVAPEDARFSDILQSQYGAVCRNYGISGTRIARQRRPSENAEYDLDFPTRVPEMEPDADAVLVFGGTNDFGHGDAPIGRMSDRDAGTFYGGLHALYKGLLEKYPGALIAVLTPTHRLNEDNPRGDNKPEDVAPLSKYVEIIREVARYYSLPVLDLYAESGLQPSVPVIRETYMPDGLHPNGAGHKLLAKKIAAFLRAV